jgi:hypothetical protein
MKSCGFFLKSFALSLSISESGVLSDTDRAELTTSDSKWMVMFYQAGCGHCTKNHPIWEDWVQAQSEGAADVEFAAVECKANPQLCEEFPRE